MIKMDISFAIFGAPERKVLDGYDSEDSGRP
jgi:hypothetical protein